MTRALFLYVHDNVMFHLLILYLIVVRFALVISAVAISGSSKKEKRISAAFNIITVEPTTVDPIVYREGHDTAT